jgi:Ca-activated chloride channel family protein
VSFATPLWLLLLLLVPVAVLLYIAAQQRRTKYAVRFTNLALLANVVSETPRWRRHVPPALLLGALALLLLGVARPERAVQVPREQATVILVMDVSGSMNAEDVEPTRLLAAKAAAAAFLEDVPSGFRVGMVSFSEYASVVLPPTHDRELANDALLRLQAIGGTAMGDAIVLALQAAREPEDFGAEPTVEPAPNSQDVAGLPPTVILLLSDGFNTAGFADPIDAAQQASELGIKVFTVALGTDEGFVDIYDPDSNRIRRVFVPPDEETLQDVATITDAEFFSALSGDELTQVYESLSSELGHESIKQEITWWFAGFAALFLAASAGLSLAWFNRFP